MIGTNARNRIPKDIEPLYLHKENTEATMKHAKDAIIFDPTVAVKTYSISFKPVHIYCQSTSSCNIASVNALNKCTNFVELREKGRGTHKHQWGLK